MWVPTTTLVVRIRSRGQSQHDDSKVKDYGVKLAVDMIRQMQRGGIEGVHFCTLNLEKSVTRVLEALGLAGNIPTLANKLIAVRSHHNPSP